MCFEETIDGRTHGKDDNNSFFVLGVTYFDLPSLRRVFSWKSETISFILVDLHVTEQENFM